ncbi:MAG: hypothetical protein NT150_05130 [Bacteroidetes bacterium]|nr:hypothetical protein [Bacteroidota bacterium]
MSSFNSIFAILAGTWFVVSSNFPLWLEGSKTNPQFNYAIAEKKGEIILLDEVTYLENGKSKSISGFDYLNPTNNKAFTWQGKGWLAIAKSNWEIKLKDEQNQWAVIWFSKTIFTPEGVDIISRNKPLDAKVLEEIKSKMLADSILKKHVNTLVELK